MGRKSCNKSKGDMNGSIERVGNKCKSINVKNEYKLDLEYLENTNQVGIRNAIRKWDSIELISIYNQNHKM